LGFREAGVDRLAVFAGPGFGVGEVAAVGGKASRIRFSKMREKEPRLKPEVVLDPLERLF